MKSLSYLRLTGMLIALLSIFCGNLSGQNNIVLTSTYVEYFTWPNGTGWSHSLLDDFNWILASGPTPTNLTGPSAPAIGPLYTYAEANGHNNQEAYIVSPVFDISAFTIPTLNFNYHMSGTDMGTLIVDVSANGGNTWGAYIQISGDQGPDWNIMTFNMPSYVIGNGRNVRFRFRAMIGNGNKSDIALDYFKLSDSAPRLAGGQPSEILPETPQLKFREMTAYPNPAGSSINVAIPELEGPGTLKLFDLQGKIVLKQAITNYERQQDIDLSSLAPGSYYLRLDADGFSKTLKIVHQ